MHILVQDNDSVSYLSAMRACRGKHARSISAIRQDSQPGHTSARSILRPVNIYLICIKALGHDQVVRSLLPDKPSTIGAIEIPQHAQG